MAKVIVSGNLNQYGNAGQFETDRSTWGFADPSGRSIVRSAAHKTAGLYSAQVTALNGAGVDAIYGKFTAHLGKKYIIKAKVRTPSGAPISNNGEAISLIPTLGTFIIGLPFDVVTKTVAEATDNWVEIEASVEHTNTTLPVYTELVPIRLETEILTGGQIFVDQFEIYEYDDDDTPIVCDLDIDEEATTVTNESSEGAGNGSVEVEQEGSGSYEYSKDDGDNYQPSNLFTGLTTGIYIIKVRDTGVAGCEDRYPFAVNHAAVTHDFTAVVTHESISGAHDGSITFYPTGTGGPYEFTIDAGQTWQAGNNFAGLAPGTYFVAVRNAAGNSVVKVVVVNQGSVEINKVFHSRNFITFDRAATPTWQSLTNYRLYCEVRVEDEADSGIYNPKLKFQIPPNDDGLAVFYLRPAFRGVLNATPPPANQNTIVRLTDRIKRFKTYTGELQDDQVTPPSLQESLINLVIMGGIDKFRYPDLNFFTSYLQTHKKFLTWAPLKKVVDRNQEDYLCFYAYANFSTLKLQVKAYYADGTDQTSVTRQLSNTGFSQLYQVPAGPLNSGATLIDPTKTLIRYELTMLNQDDTVISETRVYALTKSKMPRTRYILFLNSLGAYEVLRVTGQAQDTTTVSRDPAQRFLDHEYSALDGEFEINAARMVTETNYSSGHITGSLAEQWHEYFKDLLLSTRVYDITDGRRLPIVITESEHTRTDQDYSRFVRFTARRAYDDENFTPSAI